MSEERCLRLGELADFLTEFSHEFDRQTEVVAGFTVEEGDEIKGGQLDGARPVRFAASPIICLNICAGENGEKILALIIDREILATNEQPK